jgi:hypothetical protein
VSDWEVCSSTAERLLSRADAGVVAGTTVTEESGFVVSLSVWDGSWSDTRSLCSSVGSCLADP